VNKKAKPFEVFIQKDKPRSDEVYSQYRDMDGNFFTANLDYNDIDFTNYVYVNFSLQTPEVNGNVYLTGGFNYWNLNQENLMHYDSAHSGYTGRILLKQGWYDYQYAVKSSSMPPYYFEGSHYETQNSYEIFVYHKAIQLRAEHLIGYIKINENPR
jgi:hypothetical protein